MKKNIIIETKNAIKIIYLLIKTKKSLKLMKN